ncbi:MAG TPA: N-acetylglucosamine-6-phosphate deacetylase [Rubrobacteraceae bacterium]|nr:N-acetylglucosamine-6-phosphate deacetylase [Rubrobacteraceae bacterium]
MRESEGKLVALRGQVVTDYEVWPEGTVLLEGGSIADVSPDDSLLGDAGEVYEYTDSLLLPGFVDLQVNGAFGVDVATEPLRAAELSKALLATGTTSYLPTIISSAESLYEEVLPVLAAAEPSSGAEPLGVHLEGPFINVDKKGAHAAAHIVPPDPGLLAHLLDLGPVRMVTLAPELEGAEELMTLASRRGVVVSAGHSGAPFEVAYEAFDASVAGVTHLFNAMSAMHHREPGLPGAAFAHPRVVCGLIADGLHVHPELVALAFRMLGPDRVCLVSDDIAAAGMGDGVYRLAARTVYLDGGVPTLGSGAIAGSVLTMSEAFRNILAFTGCTVPEAARMASTTPARLVGEGRRKGRLAPGYDADMAVLGADLSVEAVWRAGQAAYEKEGSSR